jgi:hypothetical protein
MVWQEIEEADAGGGQPDVFQAEQLVDSVDSRAFRSRSTLQLQKRQR